MIFNLESLVINLLFILFFGFCFSSYLNSLQNYLALDDAAKSATKKTVHRSLCCVKDSEKNMFRKMKLS